MEPIQIIALSVAILSIIKLLFILTNPKSWFSMVKSIYSNKLLTTIVSTILALVVLNFLIKEITIVQIFAVMAFVMLLFTLTGSSYGKDIISLAEKRYKDKNKIKNAWFPILIWVLLLIWLLFFLFFNTYYLKINN